MKKRTLQRLEALEERERLREWEEQTSLGEALVWIWTILFAFYLGGLESAQDSDLNEASTREGGCVTEPGMIKDEVEEARARALKYPSAEDCSDAFTKALHTNDELEVCERYIDAYRRLFAKIGLDFDSAPPNVLFDAFVTMVNQLPDRWLHWLRTHLREAYSPVKIEAGSNLPETLSADNFLEWKDSQ